MKQLYCTLMICALVVLMSCSALCFHNAQAIHPNTKTKIKSTIIDGAYYLRNEDPYDKWDLGSLLRENDQDQGIVFCDSFIVFHFAQPGQYHRTQSISSIYYHLWHRTPQPGHPYGELFSMGYSTVYDHSPAMNESITLNVSQAITTIEEYGLTTTVQHTNPAIASFYEDEIFNFSVKIVGSFPKMINSPEQQSFIIINVEDNQTLQQMDRDQDFLSDYDELFLYYTNPFNKDTDNDQATDYEEVHAEQYGQLNSNPNDYQDTTDYRVQLGDTNRDGTVNFDDIDAFVLAVVDQQQYQNIYGIDACVHADCNRDNIVTFDDIDPFINYLCTTT